MVPLCHIFNAIHHMGGVFHIIGEEILCFDKYYEICIDLSEQSSNGVGGDGMVQCVDKFDVIGLSVDVYAAAVVKVGGRSDIQIFTHLELVGNNTKLWTRFLKKWFQQELKCVLYARFRVLIGKIVKDYKILQNERSVMVYSNSLISNKLYT